MFYIYKHDNVNLSELVLPPVTKCVVSNHHLYFVGESCSDMNSAHVILYGFNCPVHFNLHYDMLKLYLGI